MALIDLSRKKSAPFTARRVATLGFFVTLLIVVGWLHFTGAAATRGIERKDMDWNNDGNVTMREMLQSFYAVTVTTACTSMEPDSIWVIICSPDMRMRVSVVRG